MTLPVLTLPLLKIEIGAFAKQLSQTPITQLYGVTDGKAVGTYVEQALRSWLTERYEFTKGNSALGIDFPELNVDLKVTSIRQPQSSSPFRSANQKIYGLGYDLIIMIYDKHDDPANQYSRLDFQHLIYLKKELTADYQTTAGITQIINQAGNIDDIDAYLEERQLPLDPTSRRQLAEQILQNPPVVGYLTISNALQWRLQYTRVMNMAKTATTIDVEDLLGQ
jgi:hypothetical protein